MSTVKERLRAVEVELTGLRRDLSQFQNHTGKKFDVVFKKIDNIAKDVAGINPNTKLSGRDKAYIIAALIMAIASIIVALVK